MISWRTGGNGDQLAYCMGENNLVGANIYYFDNTLTAVGADSCQGDSGGPLIGNMTTTHIVSTALSRLTSRCCQIQSDPNLV